MAHVCNGALRRDGQITMPGRPTHKSLFDMTPPASDAMLLCHGVRYGLVALPLHAHARRTRRIYVYPVQDTPYTR